MTGIVKRILLSAASCCALAAPAFAIPGFSVTPQGLNGSGNRIWKVDVNADPALIVGGTSSLAIEMGFQVTGADLLSAVVVDTAVFDTPNPGNSPFPAPINGIQTGLVLDLANERAFAAYGTAPFTTGTPATFLNIVTAGSGLTTINWLGAYSGNGRIAQEGLNYSSYRGSVTAGVPEPATLAIALGGLALFALARRKPLAA